VVCLLAFLSLLPLFLSLYYITMKGISVINWDFLFSLPRPIGEAGGALSTPIVGTLMLIVLSSVISVPCGFAAGIYLSENKAGKLSNTIRLCVIVLQGTPSIVIGIIAYLWCGCSPQDLLGAFRWCRPFDHDAPRYHQDDGREHEAHPYHLKEASLALGVPYYRTILKVVLLRDKRYPHRHPPQRGEDTGETAPLLFTAFGNQFMNVNIFKPIDSLPYRIFYYAMSPYPEWHSFAWGASSSLSF
jgi:phosphate transport system permease protein